MIFNHVRELSSDYGVQREREALIDDVSLADYNVLSLIDENTAGIDGGKLRALLQPGGELTVGVRGDFPKLRAGGEGEHQAVTRGGVHRAVLWTAGFHKCWTVGFGE